MFLRDRNAQKIPKFLDDYEGIRRRNFTVALTNFDLFKIKPK